MWRAACHGLASLEAAGGFGLPQSVDTTFAHLMDALDAEFHQLGTGIRLAPQGLKNQNPAP
jgi:Tetracyclin repressor-like, C-terminal domain